MLELADLGRVGVFREIIDGVDLGAHLAQQFIRVGPLHQLVLNGGQALLRTRGNRVDVDEEVQCLLDRDGDLALDLLRRSSLERGAYLQDVAVEDGKHLLRHRVPGQHAQHQHQHQHQVDQERVMQREADHGARSRTRTERRTSMAAASRATIRSPSFSSDSTTCQAPMRGPSVTPMRCSD